MAGDLSPLLQLAVVLIAAKVCGSLSRYVNQPEVLGELIVGMILGPSVLGIIAPQEVFRILAELGAILLLFEVGLESDIRSLALVGRASTLVAALGSLIPFLSGYLLFQSLGYGRPASAFLGASMVATSVGISARVLSDLGKLRAKESRATLGAAVIDDVVGLLVLSMVLSLFAGGRFEAQKILKVVAYVSVFFAVSLGLGLKIIPAASRMISEKMKARGALLSFALAVGILVGHAAEAIGLAAIIGAFIAGMLFAETEQKDTIANDVRPLS
ncbi:TPA: cation:proton antiporter, partial [Candidatus Bathyarchaeota archaeon]|nr:cation:proton antiporter [Candidatus Bathyarchaeota archaeon]